LANSRYRGVMVIAAQNALQPSSDLGNRRVHPAAQFLLPLLQFLPPSFAVRNAPDFEPAQPVLSAIMLESQEGERLRFSRELKIDLGHALLASPRHFLFLNLWPSWTPQGRC
jgi:hypothetical protein